VVLTIVLKFLFILFAVCLVGGRGGREKGEGRREKGEGIRR
jgi:hypothetical protein